MSQSISIQEAITLTIEKMSPENVEQFNTIAEHIRNAESSVSGQRRESLILSIGKEIVKYQAKGKLASDLYGTHFEQFAKTLLADVEQRKPRTLKDKIKFYLMIPWAALTILFAMYTGMGFLNKWRSDGGSISISTSFLFMICGISVLLILVVTKFLEQPIEENEEDGLAQTPAIKPFDLKALGTYIGIAVIFAGVGYYLSAWLPTFTLTAWGCLIVFLVGLLGFRVFFRFK